MLWGLDETFNGLRQLYSGVPVQQDPGENYLRRILGDGHTISQSQNYTILFKWEVAGQLKFFLTERLADVPNLELVFPEDCSEENLLRLAQTADVIIGWRPTEKLLKNAPNLKLFINPGVGVHHLIPLFRKIPWDPPVTLINGHGNTFFTAQHAVSLLLAVTNKVVPHHNWMAEGKWRTGDKEAKSFPLRGITIGLLGYGHINQQVHRLLANFPVEFAILRRSWGRPAFFGGLPQKFSRYEGGQLSEFLKAIDVLIIALPQTEKTTNMIDAPQLACLHEGAFLVNVSRGPVVNEEALFTALNNHQIQGAAIDVWYEYHPEPDIQGRKYPYHFPFHTLDNVVLSPHRAASPFDDLRRWGEVVENLRRLAQGRQDFLNVVDLDAEY